jgi:SagB-type dehydrogenase family enzyme
VTDGTDSRPWVVRRPAADEPGLVETVALEHVVVGTDSVPLDDPTENYHEASRIHPGMIDPHVTGARQLERSPEVRVSATRSVKRHAHLPALSLPPRRLGDATLERTLATRRSLREYGEEALALEELASVLGTAYGVTGVLEGTTQELRAVPSGGALFPLELYVACARVDDADQALYHYDPLRHVLERLRSVAYASETEALTPYPELLRPSAAVIVVTAMFWRSRFKYGARAYRFALLEAGHLGQNVLLATTALGLAAVPVGGFYDRRVDEFVGVDGLWEASLYLFPIGRSPG